MYEAQVKDLQSIYNGWIMLCKNVVMLQSMIIFGKVKGTV